MCFQICNTKRTYEKQWLSVCHNVGALSELAGRLTVRQARPHVLAVAGEHAAAAGGAVAGGPRAAPHRPLAVGRAAAARV